MVSALLSVLIFMPVLPLPVTVAVMVFIGVAGGTMTSCFALVRDVMPDHLTGAAIGIVNSLTVASGAVLQPVVGLLLDLLAEAGPASYTAASYQLAFLAILVTALAGLLVAFRLRERG